jgi:hypothetical protein
MILGEVISMLNLNQKWAPKYLGQQGGTLKTDETLRFLRASVSLKTVRNTSILEVTVYSDKPEEAAQLANAIVESYRDHRLAERQRKLSDGIQVLGKAYEANREQVRGLRAELASRSPDPRSQGTNRLDEAERRIESLQGFGQVLFTKIAIEKTDLSLPATSMVQIIERAVPGIRPVRPNKPFNLALGLLVGGLAGFFLAGLVYVLQVLALRRLSPVARTQYPGRFRAIMHILIALTVGIVLGYLIALPLDWGTLIGAPLFLLLCGGASAYIELAHPRLQPEPATSSRADRT